VTKCEKKFKHTTLVACMKVNRYKNRRRSHMIKYDAKEIDAEKLTDNLQV